MCRSRRSRTTEERLYRGGEAPAVVAIQPTFWSDEMLRKHESENDDVKTDLTLCGER